MKNKLQKTIYHVRFICLMMIIGFITANVTNLQAQTTLGQVRKNVKMTNVTVQQLVDKLGVDFEYSFFIVDEKVSKSTVSVDLRNSTINQILDKAFEGKEIIYTIKAKSITITENKEQPKPKSVNKIISGVVTDKNGATIIGASVRVVGLNTGTMTDINGNFSLNTPTDGVLHVSYIGYVTEKVPVNEQTKFNISLGEDIKLLDEVMVVGYGTIKKSDLTGSVSKVTLENVGEKAATSVEQLLQGQVSGVQITSNTGAPGGGITFSIRGTTSISGSNQPLIVLDGYPIDTDNSSQKTSGGSQSGYLEQLPADNALANINPGDIESVEILKDASATAIYGSRASNGVVMITTKRGKQGKDRVDYNFRTDISELREKIDVLGTSDYLNYSNEAFINSGKNPAFNESQMQEYLKTNTNWQDLIYRSAYSKNHQLNISGGDKKLKYALSLGYLNQEGVVKNSSYDRGSIRVNLDREINSKLKFGLNMSGSISNNKAAMQSSDRSDPSTSVVYGGLLFRPIIAPYTLEDEIDQTQAGNPLTLVTLADDQNRVTSILSNLFINYKLIEGLDFKVNGGVNTSNSRRDFYHPRGTSLGNLEGGYAYLGEGSSFNYLTEYTLNYNKTINNKHRINAVTGFTWQEWINKSFNINVLNFPNDNLLYYDLSAGTSISNPNTRTAQWALASYIGRLNYTYDNRYITTLSAREDGSTRLADGRKWDFFPSIALAWNLHKEKFMKDIEFISSCKIRTSYGLSGNQVITVGATKARLTSTGSVVNESLQTGYVLSNMANNTLHWETSKQSNIGLDLSLFQNRLTFGFEYYNKLTEDLLIGLTIPPSNGFTNYNTNQGSVKNTGYEFDLRGKILTEKIKWDVIGNISFNRNKIISLGDGIESFMGPVIGAIGGQSVNIAKVGYPIGSFYGYRIIGIYQNQQEIDASPFDASNRTPGSFKFKDISGPNGVPDGIISADDREIIGNPYPNFVFGITNNFQWKGFSLSVFIQGNIGQDVVNANRFNTDALARGLYSNVRQEAYDNRWTGEGTSNVYPRATDSSSPFSNRFSDFIVEDASYIRLKNVTFSYTIENLKIKFAKSIKLFASGNNLLTFTNYKGYDPEINGRGNNSLTPGIDNGSIPQYRTVSVGINVGFE
jgi:TonB-dependent starch-binding outer membrane protein SusC